MLPAGIPHQAEGGLLGDMVNQPALRANRGLMKDLGCFEEDDIAEEGFGAGFGGVRVNEDGNLSLGGGFAPDALEVLQQVALFCVPLLGLVIFAGAQADEGGAFIVGGYGGGVFGTVQFPHIADSAVCFATFGVVKQAE